MVSLDETLELYKNLSDAQLAVLPDTAHAVEMLNIDRLTFELRTFLG
jgi:hypothetical protein